MNPRAGYPTYSLSRGAPSPLGYFSVKMIHFYIFLCFCDAPKKRDLKSLRDPARGAQNRRSLLFVAVGFDRFANYPTYSLSAPSTLGYFSVKMIHFLFYLCFCDALKKRDLKSLRDPARGAQNRRAPARSL